MAQITLPQSHASQTLVAGITFEDGVAEAELSPHSRRYFELLGAEVTESKAELRRQAEAAGVKVASRDSAEKIAEKIAAVKPADGLSTTDAGAAPSPAVTPTAPASSAPTTPGV